MTFQTVSYLMLKKKSFCLPACNRPIPIQGRRNIWEQGGKGELGTPPIFGSYVYPKVQNRSKFKTQRIFFFLFKRFYLLNATESATGNFTWHFKKSRSLYWIWTFCEWLDLVVFLVSINNQMLSCIKSSILSFSNISSKLC